ncbi:MAG: hypothetical protein RMJ07_01710 [Nitrososphaerota archaeon]|nr:hypothetical protein [Candidatus Bathyarchaeota archaeon]MDW8048385.1 hypothetical protein [Nitrososphaerota archaeon]
MSVEEEKGRCSYLDLLVSTLRQHERNLDNLVNRLETIISELAAKEGVNTANENAKEGKKEKTSDPPVTVAYLKIKFNNLDEALRVIESLKE